MSDQYRSEDDLPRCLATESGCTHAWTERPAEGGLPPLTQLIVERTVDGHVYGCKMMADPDAAETYRAALERRACQSVSYRVAYAAVSTQVDEAVSE